MTELKRTIGYKELILTGVGIILGAGIYVIIGPAAGMAGNGLWLSFLIAALVALFTGLSYAELSSRFPKAGAEFEYTKTAFNKRWGFFVSWLLIITGLISTSAVALGFAGYLSAFIGGSLILIASVLLILLSGLLIYGVKQSAWFAIICSLIEAGGLIIIIILGVPYLGSVDYFEIPSSVGLLAASTLVFFAFIGYQEMVNLAEEVKNPIKTMPRAVIISVVIATVLYILVAISAVSVLGWERLSQSKAPLADVAAEAFLGSTSFTILGVIALFATANTVLLLMLGTSRLIYGVARGKMLPTILTKIHKTRKTPWVATIVILLITIGFSFIGKLEDVASMTNAAILLAFVIINLSLIKIRHDESKIKGKLTQKSKFFKIPLNIKWMPILPLIGFLSCLGLFLTIDPILIIGTLLLLIPAFLIFEYKKHDAKSKIKTVLPNEKDEIKEKSKKTKKNKSKKTKKKSKRKSKKKKRKRSKK